MCCSRPTIDCVRNVNLRYKAKYLVQLVKEKQFTIAHTHMIHYRAAYAFSTHTGTGLQKVQYNRYTLTSLVPASTLFCITFACTVRYTTAHACSGAV